MIAPPLVELNNLNYLDFRHIVEQNHNHWLFNWFSRKIISQNKSLSRIVF